MMTLAASLIHSLLTWVLAELFDRQEKTLPESLVLSDLLLTLSVLSTVELTGEEIGDFVQKLASALALAALLVKVVALARKRYLKPWAIPVWLGVAFLVYEIYPLWLWLPSPLLLLALAPLIFFRQFAAAPARPLVAALSAFDRRVVESFCLLPSRAARASGTLLAMMQTGSGQLYFLLAVSGLVALWGALCLF